MPAELESWQFDDPAEVLERTRGERCAGCEHAVRRIDAFGAPKMVCRKGRKYGKRCWQYKGEDDE